MPNIATARAETEEKTTSVASLIKRGTPSAWPHELTIVTDPADPLCDVERIEMPITDERILNFAIRGQIQPVMVKARGDEIVIVVGRQRWKRATVINHLAGVHLYRGSLKSVREAIERLRDSDAGKRIVEQCPRGMKLQFTLHRGTESEAAGSVVSENEQRDGDPLVSKMRRAQRLSRHGFSAEEQAQDAGVSVATMKRWISADLDKPRAKKARGKATRPSRKRVLEIAAHPGVYSPSSFALRWAMGEIDDATLIAALPEFAKAFGSKE